MNRNLLVALALLSTAGLAKAQTKSANVDEYVCVDQTLIQTAKGDVVSLPCRVASAKEDILSAADRAIIDLMRTQDFEFSFRMQTKGTDRTTFDSLRTAYNNNAHALCQSHPKMVFAEIGDDQRPTILHSCKNLR
jgi:hypothetical protein